MAIEYAKHRLDTTIRSIEEEREALVENHGRVLESKISSSWVDIKDANPQGYFGKL